MSSPVGRRSQSGLVITDGRGGSGGGAAGGSDGADAGGDESGEGEE